MYRHTPIYTAGMHTKEISKYTKRLNEASSVKTVNSNIRISNLPLIPLVSVFWESGVVGGS